MTKDFPFKKIGFLLERKRSLTNFLVFDTSPFSCSTSFLHFSLIIVIYTKLKVKLFVPAEFFFVNNLYIMDQLLTINML